MSRSCNCRTSITKYCTRAKMTIH